MATRVLFIRTDRLGETLLNLPAVAALKHGLPDSSLTFLANPALVELLEGWPMLDEVIGYAPEPRRPWWVSAFALAGQLRPRRFDIAIVSNPKKELHLATWLAGIPTRIGYNRKWAWTLTHRRSDDKAVGAHHEVEYNVALGRSLGIAVPSIPSVEFPVRKAADQYLDTVLRAKPQEGQSLVAVHPWTSNPKKQWPIDRFQRLIDSLAGELDCLVAVIGAPEERGGLHGSLRVDRSHVLDLVGQLSLSQVAALCRRARVLVSSDSGPVHVAALMGTPTVVLFGTTDPATGPRRWGPWGNGHAVLCQPRMDAIGFDEVLQAVRRSLSR